MSANDQASVEAFGGTMEVETKTDLFTGQPVALTRVAS
jgi:hypothetical protein